MAETGADGTHRVWEGDGPPVVLIHGLGLNRHMWQWQLPALKERYRVLTYDLYGHGKSAVPPGVPSLSLFSEQLAGLLDEEGTGPCAVVGFSLGGMIARRFALDHPEKARALVILNSAHDRTQAQRDAILVRVEQAAAEGPAATVDAALERWFTAGFKAEKPDLMDQVRQWVMANDRSVYPSIYRVLAEGDEEIAAPIADIGAPTLVMTGEEDFGNSKEMAVAMARTMPHARAEILPGLRHMALAEAPELVNRHIVSFLDQTCR